jgi:hypothetical protein
VNGADVKEASVAAELVHKGWKRGRTAAEDADTLQQQPPPHHNQQMVQAEGGAVKVQRVEQLPRPQTAAPPALAAGVGVCACASHNLQGSANTDDGCSTGAPDSFKEGRNQVQNEANEVPVLLGDLYTHGWLDMRPGFTVGRFELAHHPWWRRSRLRWGAVAFTRLRRGLPPPYW